MHFFKFNAGNITNFCYSCPWSVAPSLHLHAIQELAQHLLTPVLPSKSILCEFCYVFLRVKPYFQVIF